MRIQLFLISILFLASFNFSSCKKQQVSDLEARSFISAYTQGMIHEDETIEFRFLKKWTVDSTKLIKAISVVPTFDYKSEFNPTSNILKITPIEPLKRGADYKVIIDLERIFQKNSQSILTSKLKVFDQFIQIKKKGLVLDKKGNSFLLLKLSTALEEKSDALTKIFDYPSDLITLNKITDNEYELKIAIDKDGGHKKLNWSGSSLGSKEEGSFTWDYSEQEFKVTDSFYDKKANEYIVYFSHLLDEKQDAKGLVRVGKKDANFKIKDNHIRVFLNSKSAENVNLQIDKSLKSSNKETLAFALNYEIETQLILPELQWLEYGVYLPSSGAFKIPFKAKGLHSVLLSVVAIKKENASRYVAWNEMSYMDETEMIRHGKLIHQQDYKLTNNKVNLEEWNEFGIDMSEKFEREKGTIYHIRLDFMPRHTILECNNKELNDFSFESVSEDWFNTRHRYYNYYRYYDYNESQNPCKTSYYLNITGINKNIHCTNVFPIIKKAGKSVHVAVKELTNNRLANGANIQLLNLQGDEIGNNDIATSGTTSFVTTSSEAKAVKITYDGEISFFPIHNGTENSNTEFDVSSNVRDVDNKMFVYTERDVWRPSDTIYLDIMLNKSKMEYPEGLPVVVRLKNPKGILYQKYIQHIENNQSIYSFKMPTHLEAKTGNWNAEIQIGPLTKNHRLRVETIKPNVVDLQYKFSGSDKKWIYNHKLSGNAEVNYLTGYPMKSGKISSVGKIAPSNTPFDNFKNYSFAPVVLPSTVNSLELIKVTTGQDGKATINSKVDFKNYKTVSRLVLDSKIDLPGGGLNTETESFIVSPFSSYVGIQKSIGKGWRGSFSYGETPEMEIIRVDQKGKLLTDDTKLQLEVYKYEKDWWYDRYRLSRDHRSRSSYRYTSVHKEEVQTKGGKNSYRHKDFKSGMYMIKVKDPQSGHISEFRFHHVNNTSYSVERNPIFVNLELEKDQFDIGELLKLKLPEIKDAQALISIEAGEKVHQQFWLDLKNPILELKVKEEWFPNFYLHISIVQNYGQENNDRPLRMYTVEKIKVNIPEKTLDPIITIEDKTEPNKEFEIGISESSGSPMEYTLALVDKGLLNLTGFQTPDPLNHFAKLMNLSVKTWDIFQHLIQFMNPSFAGVISIGGDGQLDKILDESADFNRFVPVAYHLGPYKLKGGEIATHKISLPNYLGQLKIMVVACNSKSFGSSDKQIRVVSPLMLQTQLPRSLNVTDKVQIPITLFKDEERIKEVSITAKSDNDLVSFNTPTINSSFLSDDQKTETLSLITSNESGTVELEFAAHSGSYSSIEKTKLFVNYPNAYSEKEERYILNPNESLELDINSFGFDKTKHVNLNISGALIPNFSKAYSSLIQYPHGCLEQTTSKAMSMIFIEDLMEITPLETKEKSDFLSAAILKIQSFQKSDGRFNYWENGYYHSWSDLYAGHFLIEAKEKNLLQNDDALEKWLNHKTNDANNWRIAGIENNYAIQKEEVLQAYRLYLLAKSGKAAKSAMNRFRQNNLSAPLAKILLAGAYHFIGMNDLSVDLLNKGLKQGFTNQIYRYSFGSNLRNKAIVISIMSLITPGNDLDRYYENWVRELNQHSWLSTQEKGFAFMASSKYFGETQNKSSELEFELSSEKYKQREKFPSQENKNYQWNWDQMSDHAVIKNLNETPLYINLTQRAISKELYAAAENKGIELKVQYFDNNRKTISLDKLKQGDDIEVRVEIVNKDILDQENLALSFKAPAGWEIINPRLYGTSKDVIDNYIYQDFRDDKAYTYFNLAKNESRTYIFKVKAALLGDFYMPPVVCENMYNGSVFAKTSAKRVIIK